MDIQYIRENDLHEKYVLNQLDEKEKLAYEAFLKSSPEAQRELQQTRMLISGVRAAGTKEMRREIADQVAAVRNPKTDWSLIYKAAAVLFVLVLLPAIFYFQSQFSEQQISEQSVTETVQKDDPSGSGKKSGQQESLADENAEDDDILGDIAEEDTQIPQKSAASRSREVPSQKAGQISLKRDVDAVEPGLLSGSGAGAALRKSSDIAASETAKAPQESPEAELDHVLGRVRQESMFKAQQGDLAGEALKSAPSGIIGSDFRVSYRSITFINYNDSLNLNLYRSASQETFPDFLKVNVQEDSLNPKSADIFVSDSLFAIEKKDIRVSWTNQQEVMIIFKSGVAYRLKLDRNQKTADRIK